MFENASKCVKMFKNAWKCLKVHEKCMKMFENANAKKYLKMLENV